MSQYVVIWAYLEHLNIIEFKTMLFCTNNVEILLCFLLNWWQYIFRNENCSWMVSVLWKTDHKLMLTSLCECRLRILIWQNLISDSKFGPQNFVQGVFLIECLSRQKFCQKIRKNVIQSTQFQSKPRKFNIFSILVYYVLYDTCFLDTEKMTLTHNLWTINYVPWIVI